MDGERRSGGAACHSNDGLDESTSSDWARRPPGIQELDNLLTLNMPAVQTIRVKNGGK